MRTAPVFLLLLAAQAAVLFIAPTGAVRTLSEDTSSTAPAEPAAVAAADPSAALPAGSDDLTVAIEILIAGGNCAAVKSRVRNTMNMIMSRILAPIEDEIDDIELDSTRCSSSRGHARVVVKYDLEVDDEKVVDDILEEWILQMVDVDAWAKSFREMHHLVKWVNSKGWKVTGMKMQVDD